MLKSLGSWFVSDSTEGSQTEGGEPVKESDGENADVIGENELNKQDSDCQHKDVDPAEQLFKHVKGLSGFMYSVASSATKKLSDSVSETAETLKKSVKEGSVDVIIEKTILGDFQKEQEKFVQEKKAKKTDVAVPPWVGYSGEETIQQQILSLSADRRNFLRDPPAGVQFHFDFEQMYPVALVMLQEDELLNKMRFDLVPKHVKEDVFWRNYFYRVSLIKQSAQLTALTAQETAESTEKGKEEASGDDLTDIRPKTPPVAISVIPKHNEEEEEMSTSPGVPEFVSDAFDSSTIDQEDLRKEIEQLVLNKEKLPIKQEIADLERELQAELQEYDIITSVDKKDENWDAELDKMLEADT